MTETAYRLYRLRWSHSRTTGTFFATFSAPTYNFTAFTTEEKVNSGMFSMYKDSALRFFGDAHDDHSARRLRAVSDEQRQGSKIRSTDLFVFPLRVFSCKRIVAKWSVDSRKWYRNAHSNGFSKRNGRRKKERNENRLDQSLGRKK